VPLVGGDEPGQDLVELAAKPLERPGVSGLALLGLGAAILLGRAHLRRI
jgi:hypothetical protein